MQEEFQLLLLSAPQAYLDKYVKCIHSLERPDYHPERQLHIHIQIVFYNAYLIGDQNLKMVALIHDVCKPCTGAYRSVQLGTDTVQYWSNPYHAHEAFNLIEQSEEIQQWIVHNEADVLTVQTICKEHMRYKSVLAGEKGRKGGMGLFKRNKFKEDNAPFMDLIHQFASCDNMLETQKLYPEWF